MTPEHASLFISLVSVIVATFAFRRARYSGLREELYKRRIDLAIRIGTTTVRLHLKTLALVGTGEPRSHVLEHWHELDEAHAEAFVIATGGVIDAMTELLEHGPGVLLGHDPAPYRLATIRVLDELRAMIGQERVAVDLERLIGRLAE